MTAWNRTLFTLVLASALTAFGCGDDSAPTDTGTADTGGGGDTGGGDTGGGDTGGSCPSPGDYYMGTDNCTNADDLAAVMREDYGDMMDQGLADLAATCGRGCIADPDVPTCTTNCVVSASEDAVSATCASCYTASVVCSVQNCLAECLSPDTADECAACRAGTNMCSFDCTAEFYGCSGLPVPEA